MTRIKLNKFQMDVNIINILFSHYYKFKNDQEVSINFLYIYR